MRVRKISRNLQMKVRRFMEYMHEEEIIGRKRGIQFVSKLSENLKSEIYIESYFKILKNIFKFEKFSDEFMKLLCNKVKEFIAAPDETICEVIIFKFYYPMSKFNFN